MDIKNDFVRRAANPGQNANNFFRFAGSKLVTEENVSNTGVTFTLPVGKLFGTVDIVSLIDNQTITVNIAGANATRSLMDALTNAGYIVGKRSVAFRTNDAGAKTLVINGKAILGDAKATDATVATKVTKTTQYMSVRQEIVFNAGVALVLKIENAITNIAAPASAAAAQTALSTPIKAAGGTYVTVVAQDGGELLLTYDAPIGLYITVNGTTPVVKSKLVSFK